MSAPSDLRVTAAEAVVLLRAAQGASPEAAKLLSRRALGRLQHCHGEPKCPVPSALAALAAAARRNIALRYFFRWREALRRVAGPPASGWRRERRALYDVVATQQRHIVSLQRRALAALAAASDGRLLLRVYRAWLAVPDAAPALPASGL